MVEPVDAQVMVTVVECRNGVAPAIIGVCTSVALEKVTVAVLMKHFAVKVKSTSLALPLHFLATLSYSPTLLLTKIPFSVHSAPEVNAIESMTYSSGTEILRYDLS